MKLLLYICFSVIIILNCQNHAKATEKISLQQTYEFELDTSFLETSNNIITYRYYSRLDSEDFSQYTNTDTIYTNSVISFYDENTYYYKLYDDSCYYIIIRELNYPIKIDTLLCNCFLQSDDVLNNITDFSIQIKNKLYIFLEFDSFTYNHHDVIIDQTRKVDSLSIDKVLYNTIITRSNERCELDTINSISNSYHSSFSLDKKQLLVSTYEAMDKSLIYKSFVFYNVDLDSMIFPAFQKLGDRIYPAQIDLNSPVYYLLIDSTETNIYSYDVKDNIEKQITSFNSNLLYGFILFSDSIQCYLNNYPNEKAMKTIFLK